MASMANHDTDDVIATVNVTPFVDIVLVLLIILMVTSVHIVKASMQVELPRAASGGESVESTLNLVVNKDKQLYFDGSPITEGELVEAIQRQRATNPNLQAVISADQSVAYGEVIHVIDVVKLNGVKSFALNIQRAAAQQIAEQ